MGSTSKSRDTLGDNNPCTLRTKDHTAEIGFGFRWTVCTFSLCFMIGDKLITERVENHCLFLTRCVRSGTRCEECSRLFLWRLLSLRFSTVHTMFIAQPPKWLSVYSSFVDCTQSPPESHWPHVNYFVNPHISFNCCGFVYPGDQIELGEIVGGCQHRSAGKTDECISNSLTIGATARHADSITDLNGCMDGEIIFMHLIWLYSKRPFIQV